MLYGLDGSPTMPGKFDRKAEEEEYDSDSSEDIDESLIVPVPLDEVCKY